MNEKKIIYTDGGCRGNHEKDLSKRRMVICVVDDQIKDHFQIRCGTKPGGSNNIAELLAIFEGMVYAFNNKYKNLLLKVDSQVAYHWINKQKVSGKVNDPEFTKKVLDRVIGLKKWFDKFEIQVVPRSLNKAGVILESKTKGKDFI